MPENAGPPVSVKLARPDVRAQSAASGLQEDARGVNAAPGRPKVALRRRSLLRRTLAALTTSTALLAVVALVIAASVIPPIGARRTARVAADQELRVSLAPDEKIVASTYASQRRWTDMWRESYGLVAATTERLLYIGAPPTPLLRPREDGPMELLVESYPYERSFVLEPRLVFFGQVRGLALRTPSAQVDFIVDSKEWVAAQAVARAAVTSQHNLTVEIETQEHLNRAPPPQAEVYVPYVVRRGETLTQLARRFHTSPDVLRQLNQLQTDRIKAGQRLRVPQISTEAVDSLAR